MTTSPYLPTLHAVRDIIAQGWTQRVCARDNHFLPVEPNDPNAICWCLYGGLLKAEPDIDKRDPVLRLLLDMTETRDNPALTKWNDKPERTQAQVLALLDRAIAMEERAL